MSTLRQIEANRRNAQRSTGPRSAEGKAVSRLNALKSGIDATSHVIPGEDPAELEALAERYYQRWQPATPEEIFLLDAMIAADWLKRRMNKVEAQLWASTFDSDEPHPLSDAFCRRDSTQIRLQRRLDAADRTFHRSLLALQRLQAERRKSPDIPAPDPLPAVSQPAAPKPTYPEIGFVPHSPAEPPDTPLPPAAELGQRPDSPLPELRYSESYTRNG
ncbi:MAG TPA: hypothetical protein VGF59_34555 [Bryobacteraceae bacterium]|jgi:hypothetical protein